MLTVQKETVIPAKDLQFAVMTCQSCDAQITLDVKTAVPINTYPPRSTATPIKCPVCDSEFDTSARAGIDLFRKAYEKFSEVGGVVSFRVQDGGRE